MTPNNFESNGKELEIRLRRSTEYEVPRRSDASRLSTEMSFRQVRAPFAEELRTTKMIRQQAVVRRGNTCESWERLINPILR